MEKSSKNDRQIPRSRPAGEAFAKKIEPENPCKIMLIGHETPGNVELTVTGQLGDGTSFEGSDVIWVINKSSKK